MQIVQKTFRFLLYLVLGILAVGCILLFFADPFARHLLQKQVNKAGDGQYSLEMDKFHISLLRGDVILTGVKIVTDTGRNVSGPVIFTEAEGVIVEGFSWLGYLTENELALDKVRLSNGNLQFSLFSEEKDDRDEEPFSLDQLDIYPSLKGKFSRVRAKQFLLENFSGTITSIRLKDTTAFAFHKLEADVKNFLLDTAMLFTDSRTFYSEGIRIAGHQLEFSSGTGEVTAGADSLFISSEEDKTGISIHSLHFLQQGTLSADTLLYVGLEFFDIQEFNFYGLQKDSTASLNRVRVNDLNFISNTDSTGDTAEPKKAEGNPFRNISGFTLASYLPDFINKVRVAEADLQQIFVRMGASFSLKNANLKSGNFQIDGAPAFANNRFLHAEELTINAGGLSLPANELYRAGLGQFQFKAANGISGFSMADVFFFPTDESLQKKRIELRLGALKTDTIKTGNLPSGELVLRNVVLENPELDVYIPASIPAGKEPDNSGDPLSLSELDISPWLNNYIDKVLVNSISVENLNVNVLKKSASGSIRIVAPLVNFNMQDILLGGDQEILSDERIFYSRQLGLSASSFSAKEEGLNNWQSSFASGNLVIRPANSDLTLNSLSFYSTSNSTKDSLLRVFAGKMHLGGVDAGAYFHDRNAKFRKVVLESLDIVYPDGNEEDVKSDPAKGEGMNPKLIQDFSLADNLPRFINSVEVQELALTKVSFGGGKADLRVGEGNLQLKDIKINDKKAFAENRFFHASLAESNIKNICFKAGEEKQEVELGTLNLSINKGSGFLSLHQLSTGTGNTFSASAPVEALIDSVKLTGINTSELSSGILSLERFIISNPSVVYYSSPSGSGSDSTSASGSATATSEEPNLYPFLKKYLNSLNIETLGVSGGDFRFSGLGGSHYGLHLPEVELTIKGINIAPGTAFSDNRILHSAAISGTLRNVEYFFPDKVYRVKLEKAGFNSAGKIIELQGLLYTFSENYKKKLDEEGTNEVYRINNKSLSAEGIDWKKLILGNGFQAGRISSTGLDLYVYKDFNVPYTEQLKPMPADIIGSVEFPLFVKELNLNGMEVVYEEMKKRADTAGYVKITELNGKIHNLTNVDSILQEYPSMEVVASGRLMGEGYFQSHINVPLLNKNENVRVTGTMDTLDVTQLNRIVRYNSRVAIKSGSFYKVSWDFEAGKEEANGTMELSYENLEIQLSKPNSPDTTGLLKDIGSYLINQLVVDSNIAEGKNTKPEKVTFGQKRDKERSFFHFYVQSLLAGFIEAIGVPFR